MILFFLDNRYYYDLILITRTLSFSSFHLLSCHCNFQFDRIIVPFYRRNLGALMLIYSVRIVGYS